MKFKDTVRITYIQICKEINQFKIHEICRETYKATICYPSYVVSLCFANFMYLKFFEEANYNNSLTVCHIHISFVVVRQVCHARHLTINGHI